MIGTFIVKQDCLHSVYEVDDDFQIMYYDHLDKDEVMVVGESSIFENSGDCMLIDVTVETVDVSYVNVISIELKDYLDEDDEGGDNDEPSEE